VNQNMNLQVNLCRDEIWPPLAQTMTIGSGLLAAMFKEVLIYGILQ